MSNQTEDFSKRIGERFPDKASKRPTETLSGAKVERGRQYAEYGLDDQNRYFVVLDVFHKPGPAVDALIEQARKALPSGVKAQAATGEKKASSDA